VSAESSIPYPEAKSLKGWDCTANSLGVKSVNVVKLLFASIHQGLIKLLSLRIFLLKVFFA